MIAKEIPTHPVETQKLVALGKVIDDDEKTLADYKIPDNGIIVLMQTKVSLFLPWVENIQAIKELLERDKQLCSDL